MVRTYGLICGGECVNALVMSRKHIAIIGGGPAGLSAAEVLAQINVRVTVYDAMPTPARKLLLAGKSGLNITHAEDKDLFLPRYGDAQKQLAPSIRAFNPETLREWAAQLGTKTFVGSSGRVFPKAMKASPLLRAWLAELHSQNVQLLTRHKWIGFDGDDLLFDVNGVEEKKQHDGVIFALGGASWPRLGATGAWIPYLEEKGISISPFRPANCGFDVAWSDVFKERFAGQPVKAIKATSSVGTTRGEFVVTQGGIEGSLIYHHSAALRDGLEKNGQAALVLDLSPDRNEKWLAESLAKQNQKQSLTNRLRKGPSLSNVKVNLLREFAPEALAKGPKEIAAAIKALHLPVVRPRPIEEAISCAGGIEWDELDKNFMLKKMPGSFVAGEMIDWEAPTGGYLLNACFATGRSAAHGMINWLEAS